VTIGNNSGDVTAVSHSVVGRIHHHSPITDEADSSEAFEYVRIKKKKKRKKHNPRR
jgi:hypothetical protein